MIISPTKQHIFAFILLIIGSAFLLIGVRSRIEYAQMVDLSDLDISACHEGQFVTGNITCLLRKSMLGSGGSFVGVSEEVSSASLADDYLVYTVPIKQDRFIRVLVTDYDTRKLLDAMIENAAGEPIPFEGTIIRLPLTHTEWYTAGMRFDPDYFSLNALESVYAIRQQRHRKKTELLYAGIVFLAFSAYLFIKNDPKEMFFKKKEEPDNDR